jgi:protein disulfide-isomerase A6
MICVWVDATIRCGGRSFHLATLWIYNVVVHHSQSISSPKQPLHPTYPSTMVRLNTLLTASLAVVGTHAASAVLDLIPKNFDTVVTNSGKPALVEFFAPWCGHCKKLAPVYEELGQAFEFAKDQVVIGKVDADKEKELGRKFGIQGFPTLKWFDGKGGEPETYSGGRDLEGLSKFITEKTGIKPKVKKQAPSAVEMLNDESFKQTIGKDKNVLVAFTAPWCGRKCSLSLSSIT